ncbi:hypothetical protein ACCT09_56795, partial [Rhizobium ruizarguesonis]
YRQAAMPLLIACVRLGSIIWPWKSAIVDWFPDDFTLTVNVQWPLIMALDGTMSYSLPGAIV